MSTDLDVFHELDLASRRAEDLKADPPATAATWTLVDVLARLLRGWDPVAAVQAAHCAAVVLRKADRWMVVPAEWVIGAIHPWSNALVVRDCAHGCPDDPCPVGWDHLDGPDRIREADEAIGLGVVSGTLVDLIQPYLDKGDQDLRVGDLSATYLISVDAILAAAPEQDRDGWEMLIALGQPEFMTLLVQHRTLYPRTRLV